MGGAKVLSPGRRYRRRRRLRQTRRGVVAVIGTLLALLVFFALFGIFLTQYLPLWMTDNEAEFTSQAATSFATLKSYVDSQYLDGGPSAYGVPFTMSSQGVPLLAQPTGGTLQFIPNSCPGGFWPTTTATHAAGQPEVPSYCIFQNITLSTGPGGSGQYSQHVATGLLEMSLPNRYYSAQTFYFEDDGVIQSQGGPQEIMLVPPPFNVTKVGVNTTVTSSFLQLYGNATTVVGQGSQSVFSYLRYSQVVTSSASTTGTVKPYTVSFEVGTQNPCAWDRFLWGQMNISGLSTSSYNWTSPVTHTPSGGPGASLSCSLGNGQTSILAVNINVAVDYSTVFYSGVQISLGVGGT